MSKFIEIAKKIKHKTRVRTRIRDARKKMDSVGYIYRNDGIVGVKNYIKAGVKKRIEKRNIQDEQFAKDVLMITIDDELLNRYRTEHMIEELESTGVTVDKVLYYNLKPEMAKRYNTFIFYRCPWMPNHREFFEEARKRNKPTVYAVDDLVIDRKYTDTIPAVMEMNKDDRVIYDDGVERHKKLMESCDYAITTTEDLANELKSYANLKEVFINRNAMSGEMIYHSEGAINSVEKKDDKIVIGYFSGTNTHNEDYQMVAPALIKILEKYDNVYLKLAGRIDAPVELKDFKDRMIFTPYVSWKRLPYELREADIILAPLIDNLFNRAKSEIKWSEAALVKNPVVASDVGAFKTIVQHQKTGILTQNTSEDWFNAIESLILDADLRQRVGQNAYDFVHKNLTTISPLAFKLREFINKITPQIIAFAGVSIGAPSGGNLVVKEHMRILQDAGNIVYGIETMDYAENDKWLEMNDRDDKNFDFFRINSRREKDKINLDMAFDKLVATFWQSVEFVDGYHNLKKSGEKLYLVQNFEADFYDKINPIRRKVFATYSNHRLKIVTISKWCQNWLKEDFGRDAIFIPNGIHAENFPLKKRDFSDEKVKILIEGDSSAKHKRVDESFKIANNLDKNKFEVSYLSNSGAPKDWYEVDKVYLGVESDKVGEIYAKNDILLKSSKLESFSYPPIEMMATGGVVVLAENGGNAEYIKDGENAFYYKDEKHAIELIEKIAKDKKLYQSIAKNGYEVAKTREWKKIQELILKAYR